MVWTFSVQSHERVRVNRTLFQQTPCRLIWERDLTRKEENTGFVCVHCRAGVAPVSNGSFRNHCPFCLWSLHVDQWKPGDRASTCRAPMRPVNVRRSKKGLQIVHRCIACDRKQPNIVALNTVEIRPWMLKKSLSASSCALRPISTPRCRSWVCPLRKIGFYTPATSTKPFYGMLFPFKFGKKWAIMAPEAGLLNSWSMAIIGACMS